MKINQNSVKNAVKDKLVNSCFNGIVQSVFLSAVPLDNELKMEPGMLNTLENYCSNALENAGGISLLYNALTTESNPSKKGLLADIYSICDEVATEAAIRIAMEATEDEEEDIDDISDDEFNDLKDKDDDTDEGQK